MQKADGGARTVVIGATASSREEHAVMPTFEQGRRQDARGVVEFLALPAYELTD